MNERNVDALFRLLGDGADEVKDGSGIHDLRGLSHSGPLRYALAQWLASRGVLVPSALTNQEAYAVPSAFDNHPLSVKATVLPGPADAVRHTLECIAKGGA
jgi:hypothetical protein